MKASPDPAPISRFPVADPARAPADLRETVDAVATKTGFTPNVFLARAWWPEHFRAFFNLSSRMAGLAAMRPTRDVHRLGGDGQLHARCRDRRKETP